MPRVVQGGRGGGRGGGGGRGKGRGGAKKGRQAGNKRNPAKNTTSNRVVFDDSDDDDENIVIFNRPAIENSFARRDTARRTLARLGYSPFNRAVLDHPEVLKSAPDAVKEERGRILTLRGQTNRSIRPLPEQMDLAAVGSGRLLAGRTNEIVQAASTVNATSLQADNILSLMQTTRERDLGRRQTTEGLLANSNNPEVRKERLRKARSITSGVIFYGGDGRLGPEVLEAVQMRLDEKIEKASAILRKKKKILKDLKRQVDAIRKSKLSKPKSVIKKLLVAELKLLCRWKKQQGDKPLPTRKDALIARFKATKDRTSPTVSPSNSDDESESDEDGDSVDAYDSDATAPTDDDVEFGDEVESSDEEDEESDEEGSSESEEEESDEEGS